MCAVCHEEGPHQEHNAERYTKIALQEVKDFKRIRKPLQSRCTWCGGYFVRQKGDKERSVCKCGKQYVGCCLAPAEKISKHSADYHRPGCINFTKVGEDEFAGDCEYCMRKKN